MTQPPNRPSQHGWQTPDRRREQQQWAQYPPPIPPHMRMQPPPKPKNRGLIQPIIIVFCAVAVVLVIVFASSDKGSATASPACLSGDADMGLWIRPGVTQGKLEATAKLKADAGTWYVGRLSNADHTVLIWWEADANPDQNFSTVRSVSLTTTLYSILPSTDLVNSRSSGYDEVQGCI